MSMSGGGLDRLFHPRSIAVLGASSKKGKVGYELLKNLLDMGYPGEVYPVNPRGGELDGIVFRRSLDELPDNIDLALMALPAQKAVEALEILAGRGLGAAVIYAAGFKEAGDLELDTRLRRVIEEYGVRVIGPNCAGFIYYGEKLYGGFVPNVSEGEMGLISQSGAFSAVVNSYLSLKGLGLRLLATLGNRVDVSEADIIRYFGDEIPVYMLYIEGLGGGLGRELVYAVKEFGGPVVALKGGWGLLSEKALMSHTASVAGSYKVFRDVFLAVGGYVVRDYIELVDVAEAVYRLDPPSGGALGIVTNGGGPAVVYMDHLSGEVDVGDTPRDVVEMLSFLKPYMNRENPIDLTADGDADLYYHTIYTLMKSGWPDIIAVLHVPPSFIDPYEVASAVADAYLDAEASKPVIPLIMGVDIGRAVEILSRADLPLMTTHRSAAEATNYLVMRRRHAHPSR